MLPKAGALPTALHPVNILNSIIIYNSAENVNAKLTSEKRNLHFLCAKQKPLCYKTQRHMVTIKRDTLLLGELVIVVFQNAVGIFILGI